MLVHDKPEFEGEYSLDEETLANGVKTEPNKRIVFFKMYLHLYNLGLSIEKDTSALKKAYQRLDKSGWYYNTITKWLKETVGSEPNVVSEFQLVEDAKNLESILFAHGYMRARVWYQIKPLPFDPKKANIIFHVKEGPPYVLRDLKYDCPDDTLRAILVTNAKKSELKTCQRYNEERLKTERARISRLFRDAGYYRFYPNLITYEVDTSGVFRDSIAVCPDAAGDARGIRVTVNIPDSVFRYRLSEVRVRLRYFNDDPLEIRLDPEMLEDARRKELKLPHRKLSDDNKAVFYTRERYLSVVNLNSIARRIDLKEDSLFSVKATRATQRQLQEMGVFRNSLVNFQPDDSAHTLLATIDLSLSDRFNYRVGVEAFEAEQLNLGANLPGVGGNAQLSWDNIFKRAEKLNLSGQATLNFYKANDTTDLQIYSQYGGRLQFDAPRFLLLAGFAEMLERRANFHFENPVTSISVAYNRERPREFLRSTSRGELSLRWYHNDPRGDSRKRSTQSRLNILDINVINSSIFDSTILGANLDNPEIEQFIRRDFEPRFTSTNSYFRTISQNYGQSATRNTWFLRLGAAVGGNIASAIDGLGAQSGRGDGDLQDESVRLGRGNYRYGQFVQLSAEGKYFIPFSEHNELVSRMFVGFSQRYNQTRTLPLDNRFFAGGANSVRGWQSNNLGPGRFSSEGNRLLTIGGEYKFEANLEFRQDFIGPTELAVFTDAGNVWFSADSGFEREEGKLKRENLTLGVASGVGLRADFTFFVIRFDVGQQIFAPDTNDWVVKRFPADIGGTRIQYNLAIGYPF